MVDATIEFSGTCGVNLFEAFSLIEILGPDMSTGAVEPSSDLPARDTGSPAQSDKAIGEIPALAEFLFQYLLHSPSRPGDGPAELDVLTGRQPFENCLNFIFGRAFAFSYFRGKGDNFGIVGREELRW